MTNILRRRCGLRCVQEIRDGTDPEMRDIQKYFSSRELGACMFSLCHGWGGGIVPLVQHWLLGVEPVRPGAVICPCRTYLDHVCDPAQLISGCRRFCCQKRTSRPSKTTCSNVLCHLHLGPVNGLLRPARAYFRHHAREYAPIEAKLSRWVSLFLIMT